HAPLPPVFRPLSLHDALPIFLSRHHFILLGLRGQAKTRLIRMLTNYLDEWAPYLEGCEIHDSPYRPICRRCRDLVAEAGDETPINRKSTRLNSSHRTISYAVF